MSSLTPDPIDNNTERVLVRNTASGFEQSIAAVAGLFTCGPIGALASWGSILGLQGKWTPWFILGIPSAVVINIINIVILGMLGTISLDANDKQDQSRDINHYVPVSYITEPKGLGNEEVLMSQQFLSPQEDRKSYFDKGTKSTCSYSIDFGESKSFSCTVRATVEDGLINTIVIDERDRWSFKPFPTVFNFQNYIENEDKDELLLGGSTNQAYINLSDFTMAEGEYQLFDDKVYVEFMDNYERIIQFEIKGSD